jgi:hypothetical protein
MKKTLLFLLALAVIPVRVDAQGTPSDSFSDLMGLPWPLASPYTPTRT